MKVHEGRIFEVENHIDDVLNLSRAARWMHARAWSFAWHWLRVLLMPCCRCSPTGGIL